MTEPGDLLQCTGQSVD